MEGASAVWCNDMSLLLVCLLMTLAAMSVELEGEELELVFRVGCPHVGRWVALGRGGEKEARSKWSVFSGGVVSVVVTELFKDVVDLCTRFIVEEGGAEYARGSRFVVDESN